MVVFEIREDDQQLAAECVAGTGAPTLASLVIPIGERLSGWAAANDRPMINADASLDLFDVDLPGLTTALAVPCTAADGRAYVVTLYSAAAGAFDAAHLDLVRSSVRFATGNADPARAG